MGIVRLRKFFISKKEAAAKEFEMFPLEMKIDDEEGRTVQRLKGASRAENLSKPLAQLKALTR